MRQAQINVRTRACSRTSIARTKQAALTHNVRGKELMSIINQSISFISTTFLEQYEYELFGVYITENFPEE